MRQKLHILQRAVVEYIFIEIILLEKINTFRFVSFQFILRRIIFDYLSIRFINPRLRTCQINPKKRKQNQFTTHILLGKPLKCDIILAKD